MPTDHNFRTLIEIKRELAVPVGARIVAIGSCFVTEAELGFLEAGFHWHANPQGITYNPISIAAALGDSLAQKRYEADDLNFDGKEHFSYAFHGDFRSPSAEASLRRMNDAIEKGHSALQSCDLLLLTLGTAHVYRHRASGVIVNNCHKQKDAIFERQLLEVDEAVEALAGALEVFRAKRPHTPIVLTVSPIRHRRGGFPENSLSKATLLLAANALCNSLPGCHYFPAYELMLDDLRDYRFYGEDMLHPNRLAVRYIVDHFFEFAMERHQREQLGAFLDLARRRRHRRLRTSATDTTHERFEAETDRRLASLRQQFPMANFTLLEEGSPEQ